MSALSIKSLQSVLLGLSTSVLLATSAGIYADDEPAMSISVKRLSSEAATKAAVAAMLACRKKGYQATATVVDKNGIVQAVARDTLAPPISIEISRAKAFTSANFSADTSAMVERQNTAVGRAAGVMMSKGGVLISIGGTIYGGIGVSGAPSGETDEECAKAGVEAIAEDLEMSE